MKLFKGGLLGLLGALALVLTGAPLAGADVFVTGHVEKHKTKKSFEFVKVVKVVKLRTFITPQIRSAAEAEVVKNQSNKIGKENHYIQGGKSEAVIENSAGTGKGMALFNQAPGNLNNQANEIVITSTSEKHAFAHAEVAVEQKNPYLTVYEYDTEKSTTIKNSSFTGTDGIVGVNQTSNDLNNQNNSLALSVAPGAVVALGETDLGQTNADNTLNMAKVDRRDRILGPGSSPNKGVFMYNQASGAMNNQANVVSIASGSTTLH